MTGLLRQQYGFGEAYLIPVLGTFSICLYLLLPSITLLFAQADIMWATGLCLIPIVGSVWLSAQCFGDFMNFGIVVVLAIIWTVAGPTLLESVDINDIELFNNKALLSIAVLSLYIYLHAIILSIANFVEKRRDDFQQG